MKMRKSYVSNSSSSSFVVCWSDPAVFDQFLDPVCDMLKRDLENGDELEVIETIGDLIRDDLNEIAESWGDTESRRPKCEGMIEDSEWERLRDFFGYDGSRVNVLKESIIQAGKALDWEYGGREPDYCSEVYREFSRICVEAYADACDIAEDFFAEQCRKGWEIRRCDYDDHGSEHMEQEFMPYLRDFGDRRLFVARLSRH